MSNSTKLPLWLNILTAVYFISNLLVFGGITLFNPEFAFPDGGESAVFPIQFFAIRHIAFSVPLLYGLIKQDVKVLTTMYGMFLVMTTLDIALLFINGYYIPVIGDLPLFGKIAFATFGFIGPVSIAFWKLISISRG